MVNQQRAMSRTDCIDLYWLHAWDFTTPVEEVMRTLDDAVRAGKILYCGISDAPAWIISQANTLAELRGWTPFVGLQVEYNLGCLELVLDEGQMKQLDEASRIELGFPHEFLAADFIRQFIFGGTFDRLDDHHR